MSESNFFSFNGPFFEDAVKTDKYLFEMAAYDVLNGFIPDNHSPEYLIELQEATARRFNHFKRQIRDGETTLNDLSQFIAIRNGAYKQKRLTDEQIIENVIEESRKPILEKSNNSNDHMGILKKIFTEMAGNGIYLTTGDKLFPKINKDKDKDEKNNDNLNPKKKKKRDDEGEKSV